MPERENELVNATQRILDFSLAESNRIGLKGPGPLLVGALATVCVADGLDEATVLKYLSKAIAVIAVDGVDVIYADAPRSDR